MISVITPTVRPEGLALVAKALKRQTFKDFEWIIGSRVHPLHIEGLKLGIDYVFVQDPKKKPEEYWSVYKAYNNAIRAAEGNLIISWQDFTYAKPDALQKFWDHYQEDNKVIVTGVGNKYDNDEWIVQIWQDPRQRTDQGTYYGCFYNDIEINFAAFPKEAFYAVGGFDEEWGDKYSSVCGLDVLARLDIIGGWDFKIDQTNETFSLEHGRLHGWEKNLPFAGPWQKRLEEYKSQPVLDFLKR